MSTEAEEYSARANEQEELETSSALVRELSERGLTGNVWPLTVLCIATVATLAWSIFLAWMLFRIGQHLSSWSRSRTQQIAARSNFW